MAILVYKRLQSCKLVVLIVTIYSTSPQIKILEGGKCNQLNVQVVICGCMGYLLVFSVYLYTPVLSDYL